MFIHCFTAMILTSSHSHHVYSPLLFGSRQAKPAHVYGKGLLGLKIRLEAGKSEDPEQGSRADEMRRGAGDRDRRQSRRDCGEIGVRVRQGKKRK